MIELLRELMKKKLVGRLRRWLFRHHMVCKKTHPELLTGALHGHSM